MNADKLKKLQAEVRIGGKGTQRRKKKIVHTTPASDDKKLKQTLKKLSLNVLPGIEEVNIIRNDGTVLHIRNPKAQAAVSINTFAVTGNAIEKCITEMIPGILPQLGPKNLENLKKSVEKCDNSEKADGDSDIKTQIFDQINAQNDDEVPQLIDNFEAVALGDSKAQAQDTDSDSTTKE